MNKRRPHLELRRGLIFWHYAIVAGNGQVMATSETYFSKSNAVRAVEEAATDLGLNWIEEGQV